MVNLNDLEQRLDDALAKETEESLIAWLNNHRNEMEKIVQDAVDFGEVHYEIKDGKLKHRNDFEIC